MFNFDFDFFIINFTDSKEVVSKSKCCNNHPELGGCKHGVDDDPDQGGKCWTYCVSDCEKGGFCKEVYKNHFECHCYCWFYIKHIYINVTTIKINDVTIKINKCSTLLAIITIIWLIFLFLIFFSLKLHIRQTITESSSNWWCYLAHKSSLNCH